MAFRQGRRYRLIPARANGQPAFGGYLLDPLSHVAHVFGLFVITLAGDQISAITRFDNTAFPRFGLPAPSPTTDRGRLPARPHQAGTGQRADRKTCGQLRRCVPVGPVTCWSMVRASCWIWAGRGT